MKCFRAKCWKSMSDVKSKWSKWSKACIDYIIYTIFSIGIEVFINKLTNSAAG